MLYFPIYSFAGAIDVKVFQPDGVRTENSTVTLNYFNLAQNSFTICTVFYPIYTGSYISIATYATESNENTFFISTLEFAARKVA